MSKARIVTSSRRRLTGLRGGGVTMKDNVAASTGQGRRRRHRGVRQEPRPHGRGRRQGARRLHEAARGRPDPGRPVRRNDRHGQDASARSRNTGCPIPSRAVELQSRLGKAYLDLWGAAAKRLSGESSRAGGRSPTRRTGASPIRNGRRTSSSTSSSRPICSAPTGPTTWSQDAEGSTRTPARRPSSTSSRSPTRCRRRISC